MSLFSQRTAVMVDRLLFLMWFQHLLLSCCINCASAACPVMYSQGCFYVPLTQQKIRRTKSSGSLSYILLWTGSFELLEMNFPLSLWFLYFHLPFSLVISPIFAPHALFFTFPLFLLVFFTMAAPEPLSTLLSVPLSNSAIPTPKLMLITVLSSYTGSLYLEVSTELYCVGKTG